MNAIVQYRRWAGIVGAAWALAMSAWAEDFPYTIIENGVEVTKHTGQGSAAGVATSAVPQHVDYAVVTGDGAVTIVRYLGEGGSVTIPGLIDGLPVTAIGSNAFAGCASLGSVDIPASVTRLGERAFHHCVNLTRVAVPDGVTVIEPLTFAQCSRLASVSLGASVDTIGLGAFSSCSALSRLTLPPAVTSIGNWAFYACTSLTRITIPSRVTRIGYKAFRDCTELSQVTIGSSVTTIGDWAFAGCTSLSAVHFEGQQPRLNETVFYNDAKLQWPGSRYSGAMR